MRIKVRLIETTNKKCNMLFETIDIDEPKIGKEMFLGKYVAGVSLSKWWNTTEVQLISENHKSIIVLTKNSRYVFEKVSD